MIFKKLYIAILLFFSVSGYSQNWQSLNGGADNQALSIYGDTTNNILYAAGYFTSIGGIPAHYIAKWDGTNWDSLGSGLYGVAISWNSFTMYKGQIVSAMNTFSSSKQHIASWDGTKWDSIGSNFSSDGIKGVATLNKELYAFGTFDIVNSTHYNSIAKFDTISNTWVSIGFPYSWSSYPTINCIEMYHGQLYAGGLFLDSAGAVANIARYNGSYWSIVGQGITGSMDDVFDLAVYNDELYACGAFSKNDGNAWNNIARWNDTVWKDVGGGIAFGQINSLLVLNNKLYAGGAFDTIGGIHAESIASWDGANWCGFGNSSYTSGTSSLATINHNLFLNCGNVWDADTLHYIAQWIGGSYVDTCGHLTTGINESLINNETVNIYPNPASNQIIVEFDLTETKNTVIEIKNILGQTVKSINNTAFQRGGNKIEIDVSGFTYGIYFVQLQNDNQMTNQKFIKQ